MGEFRADSADEKPKLFGHAAIFNSLSEILAGGFRELIIPGAFAKTLESADIRALFNHNPSVVLGRSKSGTLRLKEDSTGLAIEIDPPDTQVSRDLMISIERGDINQMSFGFRTIADSWERVDGKMIRTLSEIELIDVSLVTYPAYTDTDIALRSMQDAIKSEIQDTGYTVDLMRRKLQLI